MEETIQAGAGQEEILFPEAMFPTPKEEYTGVHDAPAAGVLLLEGAKVRLALVQLELVGYQNIQALKRIVADLCSLSEEHILIHCNHTLSLPHDFPGQDDRSRQFVHMYHEAVEEAVRKAAKAALLSKTPVHVLYASAYCGINVNRVVPFGDGLWQGTNERGESDHSVPVLAFQDKEDKMLAICYSVNCAPGVLENSRLTDGGRLVSADIAGQARAELKKKYPGACCFYFLGASGDQWQILRAQAEEVHPDGSIELCDRREEGFVYAKALGSMLANDVTRSLQKAALQTAHLSLLQRTFLYPGQKELGNRIAAMTPGKVSFEKAEDVKSSTSVVRLGRTAMFFCHPEIDAATLNEIRTLSGCKAVFPAAFTDGGQGYMPQKSNYDGWGYQCRKSVFGRGSAEQFAKNVSEMIAEVMRDEQEVGR